MSTIELVHTVFRKLDEVSSEIETCRQALIKAGFSAEESGGLVKDYIETKMEEQSNG